MCRKWSLSDTLGSLRGRSLRLRTEFIMEYLENLNLGYVLKETIFCPDVGQWRSVVNRATNLRVPSQARSVYA